MRHFKGLMLLAALGVTAVMAYQHASAATYKYGEALYTATAWFDANRCGPDVATDNVFPWRGACHTGDAVKGGFHDAGDHVKFGLPAAFSASAMGWAYYEFKAEFEKAGAKAKLLQELKLFSDYFLDCWDGSSFVYEVGEGGADHSYWGPPENQTGNRPIYSASSNAQGSDVCGQTAGALAIMYLNYKDIDAAYAAQCLSTAKGVFNVGKSKLGLAAVGSPYYVTTSYYDDLCWGAIWLYLATQDQSYLTLAKGYLDTTGSQREWTYCWDDSTLGNVMMMYKITKEQKYYNAIIYNFNWYKNGSTKTPAGLPYFNSWGALRYCVAEAGLMYIANKEFGIKDYNATANFSLDYCLGDNPKRLCYLTNYGSNSVKHPHHRANEPYFNGTKGMVGALVGGPDSNDGFTDDVNQYIYTEVALDYNASFLLACAGRCYIENITATSTPTPSNPTATPTASPTPSKTPEVTVTPSQEPTPTPTPTQGTGKYLITYAQTDWGNGGNVTITIKNNGTTTVNGWELAWKFAGNQKITNLWNGSYTQSGADVTVTNMGYNGTIPVGGSVTVGFSISYSGTNAKPASITMNGTVCPVQ